MPSNSNSNSNITNIIPKSTGTANASIGPRYTNHSEYDLHLRRWGNMDIFNKGEIKEYAHLAGVVAPIGHYDPALSNVTLIDTAMQYIRSQVAIGSGWGSRALLYASEGHDSKLVAYTLSGFVALLSTHLPLIELPSQIEYLKDNATIDGKPLSELFIDLCMDVLLKGRSPLNSEIMDGKFVIIKYHAESMPTWGVFNNSSNDNNFKYVMLIDYEDNPDFDPMDDSGINNKYITSENYHYINDNGIYAIRKYKSINGKYIDTVEVIPSYMGKTIDFIPIIAIGSIDNTPDIDVIPLEAIGKCQFGIYAETCRLSHAERNSLEAFLSIVGADESDAPGFAGAGSVVILPDAQARISYVQPNTDGFIHAQNRIKDYYSQAQEQGASLLGSKEGSAESGEALRLRQAAATASLKSVVDNVGKGIENTLRNIAIRAGADPDEVLFEPNKEFSTFALSANETIAMVQSWQSGGISHSTLLENFRKAGMLHAGESVQDELDRLAQPGEKYEPIESEESPGTDLSGSKSKGPGSTAKIDTGEDLPPASMETNKAIK